MANVRASLKKWIGGIIYMYRRELIIALLGAGIGFSFYGIANLLEKPENFRNWLFVIIGIVFFIVIGFAIKFIERIEKNENKKRDEKLVSDIVIPLQTELREINQLLRGLIIEIKELRQNVKDGACRYGQSNTDESTD